MDALEKAIRNAFEKGDAEDRAYREKVYRSAFAALDRALQANPGITLEKAIARRRDLQAKIAIIESEFLPAVRAAAAEVRRDEPGPDGAPDVPDLPPAPDIGSSERSTPPVEPAGPAGATGASAEVPVPVPDLGRPEDRAPSVEPIGASGGASRAPSVESPGARQGAPAAARAPEPVARDAAPASGSGVLPAIDMGRERRPPLAGSAAIEEVAPDRNDRRSRQARRSFGSLLLTATALSALLIGGWWAYRTGLFGLPEGEGPVPNPPQIVEDEDFVPGGEAVPPPVTGTSPPRDWIDVFSPSDASGVNAASGAAAEVMEDESGTFLRVNSEGASVSFEVGQGVLEQIAGRKAVFDILARGADGQPTQIAIDCDFGELGDCGRKRYEVGFEKGEYLFELDLPENRPGAAGSISVNSDFDNQGKAVDIYGIRVAVEE